MGPQNKTKLTSIELVRADHQVQKNFDAGAFVVPPSTALQDFPRRCLIINAEWMSVVAGQVERLAEHEVWNGTSDQREDAIQNIVQMLSWMGECTLITDLRQSPTDNCLLEYSQDGGQTWLPAFDFSGCIADTLAPVIEQTGLNLLDDLLAKYDGTAQSITENLTYDGSGDDAFRDYALCNSLQLFVDTLAEAELNRRFKQIQIWEDVPELMVSLGAVLWVAPIPGARVVALGLAIAAAFIEVGAPIFGALSDVYLNDEAARDAVACEMYDNLKGATPTFSGFKACLDNTPFFFGSPEYDIANAVKTMIQELEVFVTFLQIWDSVYPLAAAGFLDDCSCPDLGWTVKFLSGAGRPPNWAFVSNGSFDLAKYDSPSDYWYAEDTPSQSESSAFCTIEFEVAGTFTVEWISFDIDLDSSGPNTWNSGQQFTLYDDVGAQIDFNNEAGYHQNNTPAVIAWQKQNTGVQKIRLQARIYEPDDGRTTYARMTEIRVQGTGTIPPEWASFEV